MTIINDTPPQVLDQSTINKLKNVNTTAIIDVMARNNYDPRYVYMPNIKSMNPGKRIIGRAITCLLYTSDAADE